MLPSRHFLLCLPLLGPRSSSLFFFNDPAPPEIYPLPLPDALPIWPPRRSFPCLSHTPTRRLREMLMPLCRIVTLTALALFALPGARQGEQRERGQRDNARSEEHTSELQSRSDLVCRLLLGKEEHTSELQSRKEPECRVLLETKKATIHQPSPSTSVIAFCKPRISQPLRELLVPDSRPHDT